MRPIACYQVVFFAQLVRFGIFHKASLHVPSLEQLVALVPQLDRVLLLLPVLVRQLAHQDGELDVGLLVHGVGVEGLVGGATFLAGAGEVSEDALLADGVATGAKGDGIHQNCCADTTRPGKLRLVGYTF